jgi:hypothetical protein
MVFLCFHAERNTPTRITTEGTAKVQSHDTVHHDDDGHDHHHHSRDHDDDPHDSIVMITDLVEDGLPVLPRGEKHADQDHHRTDAIGPEPRHDPS